MSIHEFKDRLNVAFKAMRKAGLIARQSFSCCGSCAGYELTTQTAAMPEKKRAKVRGCAFYTNQDAARFNDRRFDGVYIAYGPLESKEVGQIGLDTLAVGQIVARCLTEAGVEVEWDGTAHAKIRARYT